MDNQSLFGVIAALVGALSDAVTSWLLLHFSDTEKRKTPNACGPLF